MVLILAGSTYFNINKDENELPSEELSTPDEILTFVYNPQYLGYNSTYNVGAYKVPGLTDKILLPTSQNISLTIYSYNTTDVFDPNYRKMIMERYFPNISVDNMTTSIIANKIGATPFVIIENDTYRIELIQSGGIHFKNKKGISYLEDNISTPDTARNLALEFLKYHGGIPIDINSIHPSPWTVFHPNGSTIIGKYHVIISREIANYSINDGYLLNQIQFIFDAGTKELMEFSYHWPELISSIEIEEITPLEKVLDYYHMNATTATKDNITFYSIRYIIPYQMHHNAYDVEFKTVFLIPCWYIMTESGNSYYLGIILPDSN